MCVIFVVKEKRPTFQMVDAGWKANPHGGGLAWREDGKVKWKKGCTFEEMTKACEELPLPYIAHFRVASVGGVRKDLCHPFEVSKTTPRTTQGETDKWVLFHNGDWREWRETMTQAAIFSNTPMPEGKCSDTRGMAWLCSIYGLTFMDTIEQKGVALSPNDLEFFTGAGIGWKKINGVWCSNDFFWGGVRPSGVCRTPYCNTNRGLDDDHLCSKHRKKVPLDPEDLPDIVDKPKNEVAALVRVYDRPTTHGRGGGRGKLPFPPLIAGLIATGRNQAALMAAERMFDGNTLSRNMLKRVRKQLMGSTSGYAGKPTDVEKPSQVH